MPRLIVVEGPDGSGKSTLLEKLHKALNRQIIHTGGPPADKAAWLNKLAVVWAAYGKPYFLLDRIPHISEPVYRAWDGEPMFDTVEQLDNELSEINPVIIYCRLTSVPAMYDFIRRETKDHKPSEHLEKVLKSYPSLVHTYDKRIAQLRHQGRTVIVWNWIEDNFDKLLETLKCAA